MGKVGGDVMRGGLGFMTGGISEMFQGKPFGLDALDKSQNMIEPVIPSIFHGNIRDANAMIEAQKKRTLNPLAYQMSPLEQQGQDFASMFMGPGGTMSGVNNYVGDVLGGKYLNPGSNPYLQGSLDMAKHQFGEGLGMGLDALSAPFAFSGQSMRSGPAQTASRQVTERALNDYGMNVNSILGQNYTQERQNQTGILPYAQMPLNMAQTASSMGALPRQLQQLQQQNQMSLDQMPFEMIMSLMQNTPIMQPQYGPSNWQQTMGGIGDVLGMGGKIAGMFL